MTKNDFRELFDSVLDGRTGYSLRFVGYGYVHVYAEGDRFTACLIKRVCKLAYEHFLGIYIDSNSRPYLLFSIL